MNQKQKGFVPIMIVLAVLILAGAGGASYYLINKNNQSTSLNQQNSIDNQEVNQSDQSLVSDAEQEEVNNKDETFLVTDINWYAKDKAREIDISSIFYNNSPIFKGMSGDSFSELISPFGSLKELGVVSPSSQLYPNSIVYKVTMKSVDRFGPGNFIFVKDDQKNKIVVFSKYCSFYENSNAFLFYDNVSISSLENPTVLTVHVDNNEIKLTVDGVTSVSSCPESGDELVVSLGNDIEVRKDGGGCYFIKNNIVGACNNYSRKIDFYGAFENISKVLKITFNDGTRNKIGYTSGYSGCKGSTCMEKIEIANPTTDLIKVASTDNGDPIYELTDKNSKLLKNYFDSSYSAYQGSKYEDYLKSYPILLWKDYDGLYVVFKNTNYASAAECGKPVIYLYPEKEIDVKVWVSPNGGLTVSEPTYNNGWSVRSDSYSNIYNYIDGKNYPYLFWEGKAIFYQKPEEGFVVAKKDVDAFLNEQLSKLGLIDKEIKDFKEFWLPKMKEKPYYLVTFLPQKEFDKLVPLKVIPEPDTVIRVFMDYQGLDSYIKVKEPTIKTPQRKGFTVVEWGGALNRQ